MGTFVSLVVIAGIVAFLVLKRGETLRFDTHATTSQILMQANAEVGTKKRWTVVGQSDHNVIFGYHKGPNKLVAVLLLLVFLIPGIVYLVLAGKRESLNVMFDRRPDGVRQVQVTSNGFRGKAAGRSLRTGLATGQPAHVVAAQDGYRTPANPALGHGSTPYTAPISPAAHHANSFAAPVTTPAGWYADPEHVGYVQYFDGRLWTGQRSPAPA